MAKCANCGKKTTFGQNRPWSKKATPRTFRPNLQKVTVIENDADPRATASKAAMPPRIPAWPSAIRLWSV